MAISVPCIKRFRIQIKNLRRFCWRNQSRIGLERLVLIMMLFLSLQPTVISRMVIVDAKSLHVQVIFVWVKAYIVTEMVAVSQNMRQVILSFILRCNVGILVDARGPIVLIFHRFPLLRMMNSIHSCGVLLCVNVLQSRNVCKIVICRPLGSFHKLFSAVIVCIWCLGIL